MIDYGSCVDITLSDRIKLARLIVALAKGTPERVAQISMHELGVVTKSQLPEIHYRSAAFWSVPQSIVPTMKNPTISTNPIATHPSPND